MRDNTKMRCRFIFFAVLLFWCKLVLANMAVAPVLIDVEINGSSSAPTLEPQNFNFEQNKEYVLVLRNETDFDTMLYYSTFAQNIFTRYLQGTASVNFDSFAVPAQGKVLWHFAPLSAGEFECYVTHAPTNQSGPKGKIVVQGEVAPKVQESSNVEAIVEAVQEEKEQNEKLARRNSPERRRTGRD